MIFAWLIPLAVSQDPDRELAEAQELKKMVDQQLKYNEDEWSTNVRIQEGGAWKNSGEKGMMYQTAEAYIKLLDFTIQMKSEVLLERAAKRVAEAEAVREKMDKGMANVSESVEETKNWVETNATAITGVLQQYLDGLQTYVSNYATKRMQALKEHYKGREKKSH
jgi:methanogenic corrinoid protein MtbC1